ncbi:hypothetical protein GGF50DRAFT_120697 [Schizophyllum commune]
MSPSSSPPDIAAATSRKPAKNAPEVKIAGAGANASQEDGVPRTERLIPASQCQSEDVSSSQQSLARAYISQLTESPTGAVVIDGDAQEGAKGGSASRACVGADAAREYRKGSAHEGELESIETTQDAHPKLGARDGWTISTIEQTSRAVNMDRKPEDTAGEREATGEKGRCGEDEKTVLSARIGFEHTVAQRDDLHADGTNVMSPSWESFGVLTPASDVVNNAETMMGATLDGQSVLYANIDNETTIKGVKKRGKPREDPRLEVLGAEFKREMDAAQIGWTRIPCLDPRHLPFRSFTFEVFDQLQRKTSETGVQTLCKKATTEKNGLRSQMADHALEVVVDRALVDPQSVVLTCAKTPPILRPLLTCDPANAIAHLLSGWQRRTALRRLWLDLVAAADEASIEWTTETCNLLAERGTWLVRLWDKGYLETSIWGPAIVQLLRSNDLPNHRADSAARKTAMLAASIDSINVETIQTVMLASLHTTVGEDTPYHRVMKSTPSIRNLLVDLVKDPAYVGNSEMIEQFFDPAAWEAIEDWGELLGEWCATPKGWVSILSHASPTNTFYRDRLDPANVESVTAHENALSQLYRHHVPPFDLLHYRLLPNERALYNLLTAASEAAIQEVPQMLEIFREMVLRGILTGWRDYPTSLPQPLWTEYYAVLSQAFDSALDAYNLASRAPAIQSPNLIQNAVYNIANTKLDPDEKGLGPLRWSTRLPLPCPSAIAALMDAFAENTRIENARATLIFIINALAPGSIRIRDETRPKDDVFDQERFTAIGMIKSWAYNMCERRYRVNKKHFTEEMSRELRERAEGVALRIADLVLAYQKVIDGKGVTQMANVNKCFAEPLRFASALVGFGLGDDEMELGERKQVQHSGNEVALELPEAAVADRKQGRRANSVLVAHLKFIADSWATHAYLQTSVSGVMCYPAFTSDMRKEYMQALDDLPSASDSQIEIVIRAARLLPHFPVDPFVPLNGTTSFVDFNSRDDVMIPAAIQYAVHAGDVVSTVDENPSVKNMHARIVEMLTEEDLLGEAWTPWSADIHIVRAQQSARTSGASADLSAERAEASTRESSRRAARQAERVQAAEAVPIALVQEMVERGGQALQEYQEGNQEGEYTLSKPMIAALRGVIKRLFIDVYEVHGGTEYTTQEVIDAKIDEVDEKFLSQIKTLTPQQLTAIKGKVQARVADVQRGADRMDVPTEGEQAEEKGALEAAQSTKGKRKTTPDEGGMAKRQRLDSRHKGG